MKKIPLYGKNGKDKFVLVSNEDHKKLSKYKWRLSAAGYPVRIKTKIIFMHRFIMKTPKGMCTDHINGDILNNQRSNLRICTYRENTWNKKTPKNNKTGYKGVIYYGRNFHAQIMTQFGLIQIGNFPTAIQAARAYNKKAKEWFGEFARLNIIP